MNYKILIPCILIATLSVVGIFFFMNNEDSTSQFIGNASKFSEDIIGQDSEDTVQQLPKRRITVNMDKKVVGGCDSGIIKCDIRGCREKC